MTVREIAEARRAARFERKDGGADQTEVKTAVTSMMTAFEAFKETNDARLKAIESKGAPDTLITEKLGRIETSLAQLEPLNQKLTLHDGQVKALEEKSAAIETLTARIEAKLGRPTLPGNQAAAIELKKKVDTWGRGVFHASTQGLLNSSADEQKMLADVAAEYKAMNVGTDTAGGFLAPVEFVAEIIKGIVLISPARSIVRVRQTANKSIMIPKRTGVFSAARTGEGQTRTETTGLAYGMEELTAPESYALVDISNEMLEDAAFDMQAELQGEASEQFAVQEGAEFVSGTGKGQMEGILTNTAIGSTNSGTAATIADANGVADGFITLWGSLKSGYAANATWALNRATLASVRRLKDGQKNYIWMPGLANGVPNSILGSPYVEFPDMPNEGANTYPVAYGNFKRGYTMVDRIAMAMLRDPFTQAASGNIRFQWRRRYGGQVVLAEAIKLLKCST